MAKRQVTVTGTSYQVTGTYESGSGAKATFTKSPEGQGVRMQVDATNFNGRGREVYMTFTLDQLIDLLKLALDPE